MALINSSALTTAIRQQLADLRTDDSSPLTPDVVRDNLYILDKKARIRKFAPNRAQAHYRQHKTNRDLILKSRQQGLSTEIQADDFTTSITQTALCATLAHDSDTTQKLRRMAQRFYSHLPDAIRPHRGLDNATTTTYPDTNSEVTIATAGSGNIGRGGTYTRIHGSEVAFWKNAEAIIAGMMQGATPDAQIRLESTPNGAQGYFYEKCMEALRNPEESIWTLHFYAWWWSDEYQIELEPNEVINYTNEEYELAQRNNLSPEQIKWRRYKIRELGDLFKQEYPEDPVSCFLTSGGGVFTLRDENIYTGDTLRYEGTSEYYMQSPSDGAIYVSANDWGQDNDYTALSVFEIRTGEPMREVYVNRWRKQSWSAIRSEIVDVILRYGVEKHVSERNSMGSSQIEDLQNDLYDAGSPCSVGGFRMSNPSKDKIVKAMKKGLTEEGVQLLDVDYANHEMRTFQTKQTSSGLWTYSHPANGHDDTVDARMLAHYTAQNLWI